MMRGADAEFDSSVFPHHVDEVMRPERNSNATNLPLVVAFNFNLADAIRPVHVKTSLVGGVSAETCAGFSHGYLRGGFRDDFFGLSSLTAAMNESGETSTVLPLCHTTSG